MAADPCAALFGSMKTACENTGKALSGTGDGSTASTLGSFLGLNGAFGDAHLKSARFLRRREIPYALLQVHAHQPGPGWRTGH